MREIGLSISSFAAYLALAVVLFRLFNFKRIMNVLVVAFVSVYALAVILISIFLTGVDFWAFSIFLGFFFLAFIQIFSIFYKSVSLRIVWDICSKQQDRDTVDRLYANSIVAGTFARRLAGLEEIGFITRDGDTVAMTQKGRDTARRIMALQRLLGIEHSG